MLSLAEVRQIIAYQAGKNVYQKSDFNTGLLNHIAYLDQGLTWVLVLGGDWVFIGSSFHFNWFPGMSLSEDNPTGANIT